MIPRSTNERRKSKVKRNNKTENFHSDTRTPTHVNDWCLYACEFDNSNRPAAKCITSTFDVSFQNSIMLKRRQRPAESKQQKKKCMLRGFRFDIFLLSSPINLIQRKLCSLVRHLVQLKNALNKSIVRYPADVRCQCARSYVSKVHTCLLSISIFLSKLLQNVQSCTMHIEYGSSASRAASLYCDAVHGLEHQMPGICARLIDGGDFSQNEHTCLSNSMGIQASSYAALHTHTHCREQQTDDRTKSNQMTTEE